MKNAVIALDRIEKMVSPHMGIWDEPWKILVTTIMSTRTKDEQTDRASLRLFCRYPTLAALSSADTSEVESLIRPVGFYREKARNIVHTSKILVNNFNSSVPGDLESLLTLPGVGRKVANIVLSYGFGVPAIAVDTHVRRVSNRLGLASTRIPDKIEKILEAKIPRERWNEVNSYFVEFGKEICRPINPKCLECLLNAECNYYRRKR